MKSLRVFFLLALFLRAYRTILAASPNLTECSDETRLSLANKGDCLFYQMTESLRNCSSNGYLIQLGYKYCSKFSLEADKFDEQGKEWVDAVKKCLMLKLLEPRVGGLDCQELATFAMNSHVDCYLEPGFGANSFCRILPANLLRLANIYELRDAASLAVVGQMGLVLASCGLRALSSVLDVLLTDLMVKIADHFADWS